MSRKQIIPAGLKFSKKLADAMVAKKTVGVSYDCEKKLADKVSALTGSILEATDVLDAKLIEVKEAGNAEATAKFFRNEVFSAMQSLRAVADELETITPEEIWPFPTYADLLFRV